MKEILLNIDWTTVLSGIVAILGAVATYFLNKLKKVYEDKVQNETVKSVVEDVVKYIERTMKSEENEIKYTKALEMASDWLETKGIVISGVELGMIIESAVNNLPETKKGE